MAESKGEDWWTMMNEEEVLTIDHDETTEEEEADEEQKLSYADTLRLGLPEVPPAVEEPSAVLTLPAAPQQRKRRRRRKRANPRHIVDHGAREPTFFTQNQVITMMFLTQCDPRVNYDPTRPFSHHDFVGLSIFTGSTSTSQDRRRGLILRRTRRFVPPEDYYLQLGRLVYRDKFFNDRNLLPLQHATSADSTTRLEDEPPCQYTVMSI